MNIKRWLIIAGIAVGCIITIVIILVASLSILTPQRSAVVRPSTSPEKRSATEESLTEEGLTPTKEAQAQEPNITKRMLIKDKSLELEVENVKKAWLKIGELALKYKGDIADATIYHRRATIKVKIPSDNFIEAEKKIKKLGNVKAEKEETKDVTQQHINLSARIRNLQREEERYLDFFKKAKTIDEMLKIEEQISRVRGEIESLEAQAAALEENVAYATLTIELREKGAPAYNWGFVDAIVEAAHNFMKAINGWIKVSGLILGALLPLIIIFAGVLFVVKTLLKRSK